MDNKTMLLVDILASKIEKLDSALKSECALTDKLSTDLRSANKFCDTYEASVHNLEGIIKEGRSANLKQTEQIAELSKMNTDAINVNFRLKEENKDAITQTIALSKKLNEVITERTKLDEEIVELNKVIQSNRDTMLETGDRFEKLANDLIAANAKIEELNKYYCRTVCNKRSN